MNIWMRIVRRSPRLVSAAGLLLMCLCLASARPSPAQSAPQPTAQTPAAARSVGTVKSVSGNSINLTTDAGSDVTVQVLDTTKLVRIAPGQKDLKDATPIQLADVQPGDRILVRGKLADDGKSVLAVNPSRELYPRRAIRSGAVGRGSSLADAPRLRSLGWVYAVLIFALCAEWLLRRRLGMR